MSAYLSYRTSTFYVILSFIQLSSEFQSCTSAAALLTITPCQVHNMIVQPHFGISAKTKELIEIIQAPPHLTQTIQLGICTQNNFTFPGLSQSSLPDHICRQRYTSIEVYSKLRHDKVDSYGRTRNTGPLPQTGWETEDGFEKDFILIEAGCDIFFNHLPYFRPPTGAGRENHPSVMMTPQLGISGVNNMQDINPGGPMQRPAPAPNPYRNYDVLQVESQADYKQSSVKTRSMMRNDFFRKGLHLRGLNRSVEEGRRKNGTISQDRETSSLQEEEAAVGQNESGESQQRGMTNDTLPTATNTNYQQNGEEEEGEILHLSEGGSTREQPLNPEDIGLPILILDAEFDPIMKLISGI